VTGTSIWVDADACPVVIRETLFRAAARTGVTITLVANQFIRTPREDTIHFLQVPSGFDIADNAIVARVQAGDLVITGDIPLAAEVIAKGAVVINTRGESLTMENVRSRLNIRDFMDTLRSSGIATGGAPPLSQQDRQRFANQLDTWLARRVRKP
jgi:uncharacterized protein YaiI (UPF0178 family)